jgi:hypothetical protein
MFLGRLMSPSNELNDSAEPLSDEDLEILRANLRDRGYRIDNSFWIGKLIATIDALTARVTELEGQRDELRRGLPDE